MAIVLDGLQKVVFCEVRRDQRADVVVGAGVRWPKPEQIKHPTLFISHMGSTYRHVCKVNNRKKLNDWTLFLIGLTYRHV